MGLTIILPKCVQNVHFNVVGHFSEHFLLVKASSPALMGLEGVLGVGGGWLGWMFMFPGSGTVLRERIPPPEHD